MLATGISILEAALMAVLLAGISAANMSPVAVFKSGLAKIKGFFHIT